MSGSGPHGRTLVVVNPAAGGGRCGKRAPEAVDRLRRAGLELEVVRTRAPGEATRLVRQAWRDGYREVVAVGGDGTTWEVVNGLFPEALEDATRPRLGILPLGTGNSFLRDYAEPGLEGPVAALAGGPVRRCDVARLTHDGGEVCFLNLVSVGFTAQVGAVRNRRFRRFGELGYVLATLATLARLRATEREIRLDGSGPRRDRTTFLAVCNSRFTGGKMMMAPAADPGDGWLDLVQAGPMGRLELVRAFPSLFDGRHVEHPKVETARFRRLDLAGGGEEPVLVDGEIVPLRPRRIEILPGALDLRA